MRSQDRALQSALRVKNLIRPFSVKLWGRPHQCFTIRFYVFFEVKKRDYYNVFEVMYYVKNIENVVQVSESHADFSVFSRLHRPHQMTTKLGRSSQSDGG